MSEYQYYEFRAVDSPLTDQQQAELRSHSSRALITASSFINEYHWGDLKGDPVDWMERYFDAHVYSANWGTCNLMLRLPIATFNRVALEPFIRGTLSGFNDAFSVKRTDDYWIITWFFNDDSGEFERFLSHADGPGWMGSLLPLRDELLRGDSRPLYLGWLARACHQELDDDDIEPPVPAGLASLTPAQIALTEFLQIDPDWLSAAASTSLALPDRDTMDSDLDDWVASQTIESLRITARLLLQGRSQEAERILRQGYLAWQRKRSPDARSDSQRTVAEINELRAVVTAQRLEVERQKREAEEAKRLAQRKQQLEHLAAHSDVAWATIDQTLQRGSGHAYDQAFKGVKELAEAMSLAKRQTEFQAGLEKLLVSHRKRSAWIKRLTQAGFKTGNQ